MGRGLMEINKTYKRREEGGKGREREGRNRDIVEEYVQDMDKVGEIVRRDKHTGQ